MESLQPPLFRIERMRRQSFSRLEQANFLRPRAVARLEHRRIGNALPRKIDRLDNRHSRLSEYFGCALLVGCNFHELRIGAKQVSAKTLNEPATIGQRALALGRDQEHSVGFAGPAPQRRLLFVPTADINNMTIR